MKTILTPVLLSVVLIFFCITGLSAQRVYEVPLLLIEEDFTDGTFDNYGSGPAGRNWEFFGSGKVAFLPPNNRSFDQALVRLPHFGGSAWSGAQWRRNANLPDEHDDNQILFDKKNDIVILRFRAFSDVSHRKNYCGVEVAMLEQRSEYAGHPHYGHDLSFESEQTFWGQSEVLQLDANVENTSNWNNSATRRAHFVGDAGFPTIEDLDREYDNEIIWRNMYGEGRTNIETFSTLNDGDFFVSKEMKSDLDPDNPYGIFSLVQITMFRDDDDFVLSRPGIGKDMAQTGILSMSLALSRKSDFNLDLKIDSADLKILLDNWNTTEAPTIKDGDANNDLKVNFEDAIPLVGFWTQEEGKRNTYFSSGFDPVNNKVNLQMENISLVQVKGPADCFTNASMEAGELSFLKEEWGDSRFSAFSNERWSGELTVSGLNENALAKEDFEIVFNYLGSMEGEGFTAALGEEFTIEPIVLCTGTLNELNLPVTGEGEYTWEVPGDMLLLGSSNQVKIKASDQTQDGRITCRYRDTENNRYFSYVFEAEILHSPSTLPVITGNDTVFRSGEYMFEATEIEKNCQLDWEFPAGFTIIEGNHTAQVKVNIEPLASSGLIRTRQFNDCGYSEWSEEFEVHVENYTGTIIYDTGELELFPNPASDYLTLRMKNKIQTLDEVTIYTLEGRIIYNRILKNGTHEHTVNVQSFNPGYYIVKTRAQGKMYYNRFTR